MDMKGAAIKKRLLRAVPLIVAATAVSILGLAIFFMLEALEERRSAIAASDLQAAQLTISSAEALLGTPLESSSDHLVASVATIEGDHSVALHSLSPRDAARVEVLLVGLVDEGHADSHRAAEHVELRALLDKATDLAEADASRAEQRAAVSLVLAVVALTVASWALLSSHYRANNEAISNEADNALRRRLETLLNDLPDMLFVFDGDGRITYRSASVDDLLKQNATIDEFVSKVAQADRGRLMKHLDVESSASEIFEVLTQDGCAHLDIRVTDLADDEYVDGFLVTARDVTAELHLRAELESQASLDLLTGLPNRRALDPALEAAVHRAGDRSVGFLLVDFDDFKDINDSLGHLAGDELLREAASRMRSVLRSAEVVLRLGGDEFAVVLAPVNTAEDLVAAGSRIRAAIGSTFELGDTTETARTSIGAVMLSGQFELDDLLAKADIALYEAKAAGGDRSVVFDPTMEERAAEISSIGRALRSIDADSEFSLVYQPIVDAHTSQVVSIEALLRWESPSLGTVSPGMFIPIAERLRLMPSIGNWVLHAVCAQVARWEQEGLEPGVRVALNVSAQQFEEESFVPSVFAAAEHWGISPERLIVEVTESMVVENGGETIKRLQQLRRGGIKISIDDFGSGYSNLRQLLVVPLDTLKIDRALLLRLADLRDAAGGDPTQPCKIMQAIVTIASTLDSPVVCEGVETEEQRASLQASGVTYLQGYLLGRPCAASDLAIPTRSSSDASVMAIS